MADEKPLGSTGDSNEHPVAQANALMEKENKERNAYAESRTFVDDKRVLDGAPAPHVITEETVNANVGMVGGIGGNVGGAPAIGEVSSSPTASPTPTSPGTTSTSRGNTGSSGTVSPGTK